MSKSLSSQNPLVQASLEALLSQSSRRSDTGARVERLKAAALMECAQKGYSALSVGQIAKRAKVSTASVYALYEDRDALLVAAMDMLLTIMAGDVIEIPPISDPQKRVEQLLIAHGEVYQQPLTIWLLRLYMTLVCKGQNHLRDMGLRVFQGIDAFWHSFLSGLTVEGHLKDLELDIIVPLMLGAVERCTVISRLSCGDDEIDRPQLNEVARHASRILFELGGTKSTQSSHPYMGNRAQDDMQQKSEQLLFYATNSKVNVPTSSMLQQKLSLRMDAKATAEERMLLATALVCQERFYDGAGIKEIAAIGHVSTASVYKHFQDKPALFSKAIEAQLADMDAVGRASEGDAVRSDVATAIFDVAMHTALPELAWMHHVIMASELSGSPPIVSLARHEREHGESFVAAAINKEPEFGNLDAKARALEINFLLGSVERSGLLTLMLFGIEAMDISQIVRLAAAAPLHLKILHLKSTPF